MNNVLKTAITLIIFTISIQSFAQSRIVGGTSAATDQFPYQVSLRENSSHTCGAAIINENWVITAAHCIIDVPTSILSIQAGSNNRSLGGTIISIKNAYMHQNYNVITEENDIALLELNSSLTFSSSIDKINLVGAQEALDGLDAPGVIATVSGWGRTSEGGSTTNNLQYVNIPIVSLETANAPNSYNGELTPNMLPAGFEEGGKDACQGDSGGPLAVEDENETKYLAGVVSWGDGCARPNKYGVYARVSYFEDWINSILQTQLLPDFSLNKSYFTNNSIALSGSSTGSVISWQWKIMSVTDTMIISGQNINHTFTQSGKHSIELTVSNASGSSSIIKETNIINESDDCKVYAPVSVDERSLITVNNKIITGSKQAEWIAARIPLSDEDEYIIQRIDFTPYISGSKADQDLYVAIFNSDDEFLDFDYMPLSSMTSGIKHSLDIASLSISNSSVLEIIFDTEEVFSTTEFAVYAKESNNNTAYFYDDFTGVMTSHLDEFNKKIELDVDVYYCSEALVSTQQTTNINTAELTLYPNPASDKVYIKQTAEGTLTIINNQGSIVYQSHTESGINTIYLHDFSKGMYFINFKNKDTSINQKLLIK